MMTFRALHRSTVSSWRCSINIYTRRQIHNCSLAASWTNSYLKRHVARRAFSTGGLQWHDSFVSSTGPRVEPSQPPGKFRDFDIHDRVFVVTGGGRGLGLTLAQALAEHGGHASPVEEFHQAQSILTQSSGSSAGSLNYEQVDVTDAKGMDNLVASIAATHSRLDGLIAAAGIQNVQPVLEQTPEKVDSMMAVNFKGVYYAAQSCARQMIKYQCPGSLMLIGSTSGLNAIKGLRASVYSCSKAAVIQLARSLAMEFGQVLDGGKSIRVNALCPGNIITPMVLNDFKNDPTLRATWERANMMGRISTPEEFRGIALFLLSDASSFMTGSYVVIDGGYTAW